MPWKPHVTVPVHVQAIQYNPPDEPVSSLVFDNGANQKVLFIEDRIPDYVGPGDWIIDHGTKYSVMKDKDFRAKYQPVED